MLPRAAGAPCFRFLSGAPRRNRICPTPTPRASDIPGRRIYGWRQHGSGLVMAEGAGRCHWDFILISASQHHGQPGSDLQCCVLGWSGPVDLYHVSTHIPQTGTPGILSDTKRSGGRFVVQDETEIHFTYRDLQFALLNQPCLPCWVYTCFCGIFCACKQGKRAVYARR